MSPGRGDVERRIDTAGWVSFDVFDTLLKRGILFPTHLFSLLRDELIHEPWMAGTSHEQFTRRRMRAERIARRTRQATGGGNEITLHDIWRTFAELDHAPSTVAMTDEDVGTAIRAELTIESRTLSPRHRGVELYERARRRGIPIIAVSDMYHDPTTIKNWLIDAGIEIDDVFVSSAVGFGKRHGLIAHAAGVLGLPLSRGLHIGDNDRVDGVGARRDGIDVVVLPHGTDLLLGRRWFDDSVMNPTESMLLARAAHVWSDGRTEDHAYDLGYSHLGPAIAGFGAFALGAASDAGADVALFTSRDTHLPFELVSSYPSLTECRVEYAHLSRQSMHVPALAEGIRDVDMPVIVGSPWPQPVREYIERLGVDVGECTAQLARFGLAPDSIISGATDRLTLASAMRAIEPLIVEVAAARLEQMLLYLRRLGVLDADNVELMDLGWRGAVQRALQHCLRIHGWQGHIQGAYMALMWSPVPPDDLDTRTWLTGQPRDTMFHDALRGAVPVVELLFQSPERSVERYADGSPVFGGEILSREILDPLQSGARAFLHDNRGAVEALLSDGVPSRALARPLARLVQYPTRDEARLLGRCRYANGFGAEATVRPLLPQRRGVRRVEPGGGEWPAGRIAVGLPPHP